jgi:hypothetical protein
MTTQTLELPSTKVYRSKLESFKSLNRYFGSTGCSHSWTFQSADHEDNEEREDRILIARQDEDYHRDHCEIWDSWTGAVSFRGYYHEQHMAITAHGWGNGKLAQLEALVIKAFKDEGLEIIYSNWA